jgi:hypothetical protein
MSLWSRIANVFRGDRLNREIAEEFESHIAEAMERGRDPEEARRALGRSLQQREASHSIKVVGWLDALRADVEWRLLPPLNVWAFGLLRITGCLSNAGAPAVRPASLSLAQSILSKSASLNVLSKNGCARRVEAEVDEPSLGADRLHVALGRAWSDEKVDAAVAVVFRILQCACRD